MKVVIVARPVDVIERATYIIAAFEIAPKLDNVPKGLPSFGTPAPISAVCYIGLKAWRKVQAALLDNPEDKAIIEGTVASAGEAGAALIIVARSATTIGTQRALKEKQKAAV